MPPLKCLLFGSEPFGGLSRNPSAEIVERLDGERAGGFELASVVLPVRFGAIPGIVEKAIIEHDPDMVLGVGLMVGMDAVSIETTAINMADFDVADNDGLFVRQRAFAPAGLSARMASYDAGAIASRLRAAGIPARVSHHAGTHLCNLTFYSLLEAADGSRARGSAGFVHLPLLPEQAAELMERDAGLEHTDVRPPVSYPSMEFGRQMQAVGLVIEAVGARVAAGREASPATDVVGN